MTPLLALQRNNLTIPSYKDLLTLDLKYYEKKLDTKIMYFLHHILSECINLL